MKLTISQLAKAAHITRHAIHAAIKKSRFNRLKAQKVNKKWIIELEDYFNYQRTRWDRKFSEVNGFLIFDKKSGLYSVNEASHILNCSVQHIYYAIRNKKLLARRVKAACVIHIDDIIEYKPKMKLQKHKKGNWGKNLKMG